MSSRVVKPSEPVVTRIFLFFILNEMVESIKQNGIGQKILKGTTYVKR